MSVGITDNTGLFSFVYRLSASSHIYETPRNSKRIRTYSRSRSSEVIDLCVNRKLICDFLYYAL